MNIDVYEAAVLSLTLRADYAAQVFDKIQPSDFSGELHQYAQTAYDLLQENKAVDLLTVAERMELEGITNAGEMLAQIVEQSNKPRSRTCRPTATFSAIAGSGRTCTAPHSFPAKSWTKSQTRKSHTKRSWLNLRASKPARKTTRCGIWPVHPESSFWKWNAATKRRASLSAYPLDISTLMTASTDCAAVTWWSLLAVQVWGKVHSP